MRLKGNCRGLVLVLIGAKMHHLGPDLGKYRFIYKVKK